MRVCLRALRARFDNWRNVERSLPVAHRDPFPAALADLAGRYFEAYPPRAKA